VPCASTAAKSVSIVVWCTVWCARAQLCPAIAAVHKPPARWRPTVADRWPIAAAGACAAGSAADLDGSAGKSEKMKSNSRDKAVRLTGGAFRDLNSHSHYEIDSGDGYRCCGMLLK
jgi:hypothetical protein